MTFWFPVPNITWAGRGYLPPGHLGVDFAPLAVGSPVIASETGTVIVVADEPSGFGNLVVIRHAQYDTGKGSWRSLYAHLSSFVARAGDYINQGDLVGYSGGEAGTPGAGSSTGPHLHFQIMDGGGTNSQNTIDPMTVLVDPSTPTPPPVKPKEDVMLVSQSDGAASGSIFVVGENGKRHIGGAEFGAWGAAGLNAIPLTEAQLAEIPDVGAGGVGLPPGAYKVKVSGTLEGTATP